MADPVNGSGRSPMRAAQGSNQQAIERLAGLPTGQKLLRDESDTRFHEEFGHKT